jgi:integral membrane sensor domain MASE1
MGTGNTVEALIAAGLLRHLGVNPSLERLRDVFALVALAAGLSTIASATIGVTSLILGGVIPRTAAMPAWGTWWVGDALGDVVVAPAVLVWTAHCALRALPGPPLTRGGPGSGEATWPWRTMGWRRSAEAAVLLVAMVTVSQTVFGGWNLLNTQVIMGVVAVTVLILAAAVAERERAAAHVRALNCDAGWACSLRPLLGRALAR